MRPYTPRTYFAIVYGTLVHPRGCGSVRRRLPAHGHRTYGFHYRYRWQPSNDEWNAHSRMPGSVWAERRPPACTIPACRPRLLQRRPELVGTYDPADVAAELLLWTV